MTFGIEKSNLSSIVLMFLVGLLTGVFSGVFGVGGGVILVPILVLIFKYAPQTASGTSLVALLLPVGLLGVIEYYKVGKIGPPHIYSGLVIAVGLFFGTFFGARFAAHLPLAILQKCFAVFLIFIAIRLWFTASA
jgi:uncharacterized membrane protein YfcA